MLGSGWRDGVVIEPSRPDGASGSGQESALGLHSDKHYLGTLSGVHPPKDISFD